jgi:hypothetical protein
MGADSIKIPEEVWRGIEAVRVSGKTNMFDIRVVKKLARRMGHRAAADWIDEHAALYAVGIFRGFEAVDEGGES